MWGLLVWGSSLSGIQSFPQPVKSAVQAVAFAWNAASAAVHECPASTCITKTGARHGVLPPEHKLPAVAAVAGNGVKLYVTRARPCVIALGGAALPGGAAGMTKR